MLYRLMAVMLLAVFYWIYFAKMLFQKKKGIVTDQIAKGREKDRVYYIEWIMKIATYLVIAVEVLSIVYGRSSLPLMGKIIGSYFGLVGDIIFLISVVTMKDSWRAGIAKEEKRPLVTEGIYRYSRNPAFLAFDLVYIGILLMYFNPVLLVSTLFAMVMLHLQILQEEKYLEQVFGEEYRDYKRRVNRYAGCGKLNLTRALLYFYFILMVWSVLYFGTCLMYGGGLRLSWVWLWPLVAGFSLVRVWMLKERMEGKERIRIPVAIRWCYRAVALAGALLFVIIEGKIIGAMTAEPAGDLDYVIVLGAGLRGTQPTNPLRMRIEKAAEYMLENEDTVLIASGGQGKYEEISEAQCIKNILTDRYGIEEYRILLEEKSRDTEENLKYSLEIIGNRDASVGIITNGFHELRAMSIAEHTGYNNVHSVPAVTLMPVGIHYTVREFFGMVEFYVKYRRVFACIILLIIA